MTAEQVRKILIVDDNPEDRELICGYLNHDSNYNYILWEEALGENGLAQLTKMQPDCVLLDYELPDMDGLEFLNGLAENSDSNNLPVIMLTGHGDERLAVQAIKSGALDYLSKYHLTAETLVGAVDNAIRKADLQSRLAEQRQQLEKSEALLRLALEAGRMGVWEWDALNAKVRWDGNMAAVYGTGTDNFGGNYSDFLKLLHPEDRQLAGTIISDKYKPGEKHTTTLRCIWPDSSIHWVENKFEYFFDNDGQLVRAIGVATDITERILVEEERSKLLLREQAMRQKAEQAVRRTTQLQTVTAALAKALTPGQVAEVIVERGLVALRAAAGSVLLLNETGTEIEVLRSTGYPEELLRNFQRFGVEMSTPISDAVRTGELVVIESYKERTELYPIIASLPEIEKPGSLAAIPLIVDGRSLGALGLSFYEFRQFNREDRELMLNLALQCAQALERARLFEAEQHSRREAEASQKRLAFLAEASVVLGASLDYKTIIGNLGRLVVPTLADWCVVITLGEDNQPALLEVAHSDPDKELLIQQMLQGYSSPSEIGLKVMVKGQSFLLSEITEDTLEETFPHKEHRELLQNLGAASISYTPLVVRGKTIGMVGFNSTTPGFYTKADIPLMEELARRLAVSLDNASLYQRVQQAVQTQEELNQLKDLFISIATHELRNPLSAAKGFTQLLQRNFNQAIKKLPSTNAARAAILSKNLQYLGIVDYQLERMDGLIIQLIDFSRVQNKKLELHYKPGANLLGLVQRIVEQQERITPDRRIDFRTGETVLTADFDEARLEQVLTNLINNAIKYSPDQTPIVVGVEKRCSGQTSELSPSTSTTTSQEAVMWVCDEGYGISLEDQARIFERFYRVSSSAELAEGLGLGLYISQEIVAQHGGRMWLESVPGKGSTFYFSIPLNSGQSSSGQFRDLPNLETAGKPF